MGKAQATSGLETSMGGFCIAHRTLKNGSKIISFQAQPKRKKDERSDRSEMHIRD